MKYSEIIVNDIINNTIPDAMVGYHYKVDSSYYKVDEFIEIKIIYGESPEDLKFNYCMFIPNTSPFDFYTAYNNVTVIDYNDPASIPKLRCLILESIKQYLKEKKRKV